MNANCKKILRGAVFVFSLLIAGSACFPQIFVARSTVSKNKILLGEQFFLTIEVTAASDQLQVLPIIDTIPHFEILEKKDPEKSGSVISQVYRLTSFDSGHWVIPSFSIAGRPFTDTIHMDVVFSDFDPKQDYHDIKDIIEIKPEGPVNWLWWLIIASIMVLLIIVWLVTRRKKPVAKPLLSAGAYREALTSLDELQKANLPPREFYSQVVDVFRLYIFKSKGILSLQKTTDDLVLQLSEVGMNKGIFSELAQVLRLADFVKFAKYLPADKDKEHTLDTVRESITLIEKTEEPVIPR